MQILKFYANIILNIKNLFIKIRKKPKWINSSNKFKKNKWNLLNRIWDFQKINSISTYQKSIKREELKLLIIILIKIFKKVKKLYTYLMKNLNKNLKNLNI